MKKRIILTVLVLVFLLSLSACGCKHETWNEATCETPKTCAECGETEGAPLGHTWLAAVCEAPKTCETCGATEGEALGHIWADATCEVPKTCTSCSLTEGEALGHAWLDATTEVPQTCETCGATEGERIITDARFTTAACASLFGNWTGETVVPGASLGNGLDAYVDEVPCRINIEFSNDGNMALAVLPSDEAQIADVLQRYTVDVMYAEFASIGLNADEANAAMVQNYGMNIEEYVAAEVAKMDMNDLFSTMNMNYVYYVDGNQIYLGLGWSSEMAPSDFTLDGDTLYLPINGDEPVALTRVTD